MRGELFTLGHAAPAVLLVPGSDGGIPGGYGRKIAEQGFTAFALGYFGIEGLPSYIEHIDLGYFKKALEWLLSLPENAGSKVHIVGYSRGGELALLLGCHFPDLIESIVAFVPNCYICGGFPHPNKPAWQIKGGPFLHGLMSGDKNLQEAEDLRLACDKGVIPYHEGTKEDPYEVVDLFMARGGESDMEIPVEKIKAPLLILSGSDDRVWPSAFYGSKIIERLDRCGSGVSREHICYKDAGHGIAAHYEGAVFHPVGKFYCRFGGSPEGNKFANSDSFMQMIRWFSQER